ncbi:hypothetical protein HY637_05325, partial [Candidatus Woesearchaeota archaeon]|nr:hypothetical protein [Candidatus Woesearchaeota archaeon]
ALPAALSGKDYSYDIPAPSGGTGPFSCAATPDSVIPTGLSFNGCTLTGTAPTLLGVSEKVFSFKFSITGADGKFYGPFDATLPVSVGPPEFLPPELPEAAIGQDYLFSFCDTPTAFDCTQSSSITGGAGAPYTFSATGLPLGLFIKPNGELSGKIPEETLEGDKTFNVCVIDSARVEDCKDVKISIKKNIVLEYRLSLKSTETYGGEVVNYNFCGGSAKEEGSITWEIDEVVTLTQPPNPVNPSVPFTSDEYDIQTDEYGYSSPDNFRHLQVPMKASGRAATSYDFCEYSITKCNADSFSGSYDLKIPIEMKLDESGLRVYIANAYVKDNPDIGAGDISQMTCDSGDVAEYILKKIAIESPFVLENSYRVAVFDANGGTLTGQYEDMNPYTYASGAASGRTSRHLAWTLTVERVK